MTNEPKWGSAYRLLTVICSASEGSTRPHCVLPLKRFAGNPRTKPLNVALSMRVLPPAAVTADTQGDGLNY